MKHGGKRMRSVIASLRKFLGHNDARKVTKKNLLDWRDQLLASHSAKTVSDMYLSAVRSVFQWAHDNERLSENSAAMVKQAKPKKQRTCAAIDLCVAPIWGRLDESASTWRSVLKNLDAFKERRGLTAQRVHFKIFAQPHALIRKKTFVQWSKTVEQQAAWGMSA